jgi:hypothetical protein
MGSEYKHSINTHMLDESTRIFIHIWVHFDWELFLTPQERAWIQRYIRARLKCSGFLCFTDYEFNTHLHIGLAASGKRLTTEELEVRWDAETLGQLGGLWRKEWLCEAGADLPKLMKSTFDALVKRFNRYIRPGRKGTLLARSYQAKIIEDEALEKHGGNPVRALQSTIAYIECQGTDAGTAVTPLQDPNSRMNQFVRTGDTPFRTETEAAEALRLLIGEEEVEKLKVRRETDKNSPSLCQSYYAHLADFCVIRSATNALICHAKRHKITEDDAEFVTTAKRLLETSAKAREDRNPKLLLQACESLPRKQRGLRYIYYNLAELIAFIAREGRPPPAKEKEIG